MSSIELLDRIRKISGVLHNSDRVIDYDSVCRLLSQFTEADVYIVGLGGRLIGHASGDDEHCIINEIGVTVGELISPILNNRFLNILSTQENVSPIMLGLETGTSSHSAVVPVTAYKRRIGTIFLYQKTEEYDIDDIIICEYVADVIGIELVNVDFKLESDIENKKSKIQAAIQSMTHAEMEASIYVFDELKGHEGVLVASKVSDRKAISRSVIINALRKLESAGIIESKSAGMKGTYIKVLNEYLVEELQALKTRIRLR